MIAAWWRRWRAERTLAQRPIPDDLWRLTLARFPFLGQRSAADLARLRELSTLFLADKEFAGMQGLEVDDGMAERFDLLEHALAQLHASMVECDRDLHRSLGYGNGRARALG